MRKNFIVMLALISFFILGACGGQKKVESEEKPATTDQDAVKEDDETEKSTEEGTSQEVAEEGSKEEKEDPAGDDPNKQLNPYLEEVTGGEVKVVFTNKNPELTHNFSDQVNVTIDEYQIVHVSDMNESAKVNFDDEDEGYVLTFKMTLDNQSDEDITYAGGLSLLSDDAVDHIIVRKHLVDRDEWIKDESTENASDYSSKKTFSGLESFSMTKAQFEKLQVPTLKVDSPWRKDGAGDKVGEQAVFGLPFTEEGLEKAESSAGLYPDKLLTDSIAEKEIFFAKEDINETKNIDKVNVTLHGVQYANITPTEGYKESFRNFGDGPLVALTAKVTLENNSDIAFDKSILGIKLQIDENRATMFSQGMLEPTAYGVVEPGETFEKLIVFLFREDEFQIYKKLELQVGPLADENAKRIFKEKSVTFDLPVQQ